MHRQSIFELQRTRATTILLVCASKKLVSTLTETLKQRIPIGCRCKFKIRNILKHDAN